jgi:ribosomal-protein-alanine acetyltransferase
MTTEHRPATVDDAVAITAIEQDAFGVDAWSATLVEQELAGPARVVLVAVQDGEVVGYASVSVVTDVADLTRIAVLTGQRRRGVARALLDAVVAAAAERGAQRLLLEVEASNSAATSLYRAVGAQEISRRRDYYGPGADALVMELAPLAGHATLDA